MDISGIFRAYDIRGLVESQLTNKLYSDLGLAFGTFLKPKGIKQVVVGFDSRPTSEGFAQALIESLLSLGIDIYNLGLVTTPLVYFAQYHLEAQAAAIVTASHNPIEYNGLKLSGGYSEGLSPEEIQEIRKIYESKSFAAVDITGKLQTASILDAYISYIKEKFPVEIKKMIAIDAQFGVVGRFAPEIFRAIGANVIEKNTSIDQTFPLGIPDPMDTKYQKRLAELVSENHADIGFSFDADADRLGVVDENGTPVWSDFIIALLSEDTIKKNPGASIVYNSMCSKIVTETIDFHGGNGYMWKVGSPFIKSKMKETGSLFGGELVGHFFFSDNFGYDDPIFTAIRLLQIIHERGKNPSEIFSLFKKYKTSIEIKLGISEDIKFQFIEDKVQNALLSRYPNAKLNTIDGARVEWETGMIIVRASQNGPYMTMKFEATTDNEYENVREFLFNTFSNFSEVNLNYHHSAQALAKSNGS